MSTESAARKAATEIDTAQSIVGGRISIAKMEAIIAAACQTVAPPQCTCGFLQGSAAIGSKPCPVHSGAVSTPPDKRAEAAFDKLMDQGFFEDVKDWPPSSRDECLEILRELAGAAVSTPRCPKCKTQDLIIGQVQKGLAVLCQNCGAWPIESLADFAQFFHPAPSPPQWISVKERLPEDDADVFAAIWWNNGDNPEYSGYQIHDCLYYEGGTGSGQKIFVDCEGEEFEHTDVQFWIYKKDLAATVPPVASPEHFVHSPEAKKIIEASREKDRKPVASPQGESK